MRVRKFLRGSRELHCREYFSPWTVICQLFVIKNPGFDCKNYILQTSSSKVNREIKSTRIVVGVKYSLANT